MRRKKCKYGRVPQAAPKTKHAQGVESTSDKPLLKRTYMKVISFTLAFLLVAAALIVPSTTLAPDVEAIANQKAIAFSVGDLEDFSNVIIANCKTEEATQPVTEQETTKATEATTVPATTAPVTTEPETEPATEAETETEPAAETADAKSTIISSDVADNVSRSDYLLSISNPDLSYNPGTVSLYDSDRELLERLVMGEAGSLGFTGCALIAQAVKDTMLLEGISSVSDVISRYGYSASTSIKPNEAARDAVSYVFDKNGSAVQHRILYFYESSICSSSWHESQNFIVQYENVKFFDRW